MKTETEVLATSAEFAEFLHGLSLESIEIEGCLATVRDPMARGSKGLAAAKLGLAFGYDASLIESHPNYFVVSAFHGVRIVPDVGADPEETWMAQLEIEYRLRYRAKAKMTKELFEPFKAVTLKLNTVPFAREWIHSTSVKMGLKPIILPLAVSVDKPRTTPRRIRKERR